MLLSVRPRCRLAHSQYSSNRDPNGICSSGSRRWPRYRSHAQAWPMSRLRVESKWRSGPPLPTRSRQLTSSRTWSIVTCKSRRDPSLWLIQSRSCDLRSLVDRESPLNLQYHKYLARSSANGADAWRATVEARSKSRSDMANPRQIVDVCSRNGESYVSSISMRRLSHRRFPNQGNINFTNT